MTDPAAPLSAEERAAAKPAEPAYTNIVPAPEPYKLPRYTAILRRKDPVTGEKIETRHPLLPKHQPSMVDEYRMPSGALAFVICRWEEGTSDLPFKHLAVLTYGEHKGTTGWHWKGMPAPRPLLNAPLLAAHPTAPVLIVEGEKTARAAPRYLPDGWLVTTWNGGVNSIPGADWSLLKGHRCVIWLDNDKPGWDAAVKLSDHLHSLGIACSLIPYMQSWPDKWDLADPLPEGITPEQITAKIRAAAEQAYAPPPKPPEPEPTPEPARSAADSVTTEEFQPVGYADQEFYFISKQSQQIHKYAGRALLKEDSLIELVPDHSWWSAKYPEFNNTGGNISWKHIGAALIQSCYAAGVFSLDRIRGRGVWFDDGRIVLHAGDQLVIDGTPVRPSQILSNYIYPISTRFADLTSLPQLSDDQARTLRKLCNSLRWENEIYGDLLCGLIATSVVCGALKWRTHGWVTGPRGAGKSWLVENIIGACLGDIAIYPVGVTSEAGIRQYLKNDARPVVFDEAEGRGPAGIQRREAIIELMRMSASEGRGRIYKGGAGHESAQFTIRSQFILASIGVGLREGADETRCIVMTLRSLDANTEQRKKEQEEHFRQLRDTADSLPDDMPARLLGRMTGLIPVLRQNIELFSGVIATKLGDRRLGDRLGTPLAGCYTLVSGQRAETSTIESYLDRYDWGEFTRQHENREDLSVLAYLGSCVVKAQMNSSVGERSIAELACVAARVFADERISCENARDNLSRHGIKWDAATDGFYIANQHHMLDNLMRGSDYAQGYQRILARHPECKVAGKAIRFAGVLSRAIWVPKHLLAVDDAEARPPLFVAGQPVGDEPLPIDPEDDYER